MFAEVFYSFVARRDSFRGTLLRERLLVLPGLHNVDVVGVPDRRGAVGDVSRQVARLRGAASSVAARCGCGGLGWLLGTRAAAAGRRERTRIVVVASTAFGAVVSRSCYTW